MDIQSPTVEHRILKRGLPDLFLQEIPVDEKDPVEHVCFVVHGIGAACDIKFRSLIECVEDLRQTSRIILQNHYKSYIDSDKIHRTEFIPINWHGDLHLESTGVDNHLTPITLPSVFKLRTFINTTLADILFYTSPIYCQRIVTRCTNEMNRLYELFLQRNPTYTGQISVIGHSLGSVILYDILSNQTHDLQTEKACSLIEYNRLKFPVAYFFALGSPIAMFLTIRGVTSIASDFTLPTCKGLLHIFHPYDPIAYRIEPLIDPEWKAPPVLLSHHKGRKRIHFEIADRLPKPADVKRRMADVFKNTVTSVTSFVDSYRVLPSTSADTPTTDNEHENDDEDTHVIEWDNRSIGKLNQGRRIDYVLQHGPIEAINEYIFAFTSHVQYWTSEDTMLLILKEIFQLSGYEPETRFETIEQMVKSNVLYCFTKESPSKIDQFRPYQSSTVK